MMKLLNVSRTALVLGLALAGAARLFADVVETKSGARIVGKINAITDGKVIVQTDYADRITVKQSEVTSITTDSPVAVRLESGTRMDGTVSSTGGGALRIAGSDGAISTTVDKVAASWPAGDEDPALSALRRSWAYEAAVDISGKSGNKDQLATGASFRATLATPQDTLQFYTAYDRQESDGVKSADQFKVGVDYANNFSGRKSWYVRDEGGFDRIKDIELYNVAAAGFGYDFVKEDNHLLTARLGISYRYEGYRNPATEDVKSAGLDIGFNHRLRVGSWELVNRLSIVPLFEDFGNYRLTHESTFEIPLADPSWKLRLGVSNDYNSEPGVGVEELDTAYFTRLVLSWK